MCLFNINRNLSCALSKVLLFNICPTFYSLTILLIFMSELLSRGYSLSIIPRYIATMTINSMFECLTKDTKRNVL